MTPFTLSRGPLILFGLLYLAVPNILFLSGWVRPLIAIPVIALICFSCYRVWKISTRDYQISGSSVTYTGKDLTQLAITLLILLGVTDLIGLHGHVEQSVDFDVRNPIYNLLINENWPLYNRPGEYFVYYHSFWLPAALAARLLPGIVSPATLLFVWTYLGLALFIFILFTRLKGQVLGYTILLLLLGNLIENFNGPYLWAAHEKLPAFNSEIYTALQYIGCGTKVRYFHFWGGMMYMFNHVVPSLIVIAFFIARLIPRRFYLFPATLLLMLAPFTSLTFFPLLVLILWPKNRTEFKECLSAPENWTCLFIFLIAAAYLSCQTGVEGASSFRWIWEANPYSKNNTHAFMLYAPVRILRVVLLSSCILIPLVLLLHKRYIRTCYFKYLIFLTFFIPICWVGRANNEIMYKGSLILFMYIALLLTLQWNKSTKCVKCAIALFAIFSAFHIYADIQNRHLLRYSWNPEVMSNNLRNSWEGHLNHPEKYEFANFFGQNKYPSLLYNHPGEAMRGILQPLFRINK